MGTNSTCQGTTSEPRPFETSFEARPQAPTERAAHVVSCPQSSQEYVPVKARLEASGTPLAVMPGGWLGRRVMHGSLLLLRLQEAIAEHDLR